jgi:hypothetical protein
MVWSVHVGRARLPIVRGGTVVWLGVETFLCVWRRGAGPLLLVPWGQPACLLACLLVKLLTAESPLVLLPCLGGVILLVDGQKSDKGRLVH